MRDVISTNMLRFLWTARQSVYFTGRVRREKKSFNVFFPVPLSVFSLDPDLCLTARAYLNAQKHGPVSQSTFFITK